MISLIKCRWSIARAFQGALVAVALMIAAPIVRAEPAPLPDKPFAEHRIVLQLSDYEPRKQSLVVSVAYNLLKLYGPDKVAIEVVTFGPGIELLYSGLAISRASCSLNKAFRRCALSGRPSRSSMSPL